MTPDAKIPEGIPTGVTPASTPVSATTNVVQTTTPSTSGEGLLDKAVRSLARFFARLGGLPDPITGQPMKAAEAPLQKATNFADKVWSAANKAVDKASDIASKTVETAKTTVNQTVEGVKDVSTDIAAASTPAQPTSTQPLETLEKSQ